MDPISAIALILTGGVYLLNRNTRKPAGSLASEILPAYQSKLSAKQLEMVGVIDREFAAAGLPFSVACAALVNAMAESGLNPNAAGDCGGGKCRSIGLFQLHEAGGGHDMTVAARKDPATNAQRIISIVKGSFGKDLRKRAFENASVPELAAIFSRDIERPADKAGAMTKRSALAVSMFGAGKTYPIAVVNT